MIFPTSGLVTGEASFFECYVSILEKLDIAEPWQKSEFKQLIPTSPLIIHHATYGPIQRRVPGSTSPKTPQ